MGRGEERQFPAVPGITGPWDVPRGRRPISERAFPPKEEDEDEEKEIHLHLQRLDCSSSSPPPSLSYTHTAAAAAAAEMISGSESQLFEISFLLSLSRPTKGKGLFSIVSSSLSVLLSITQSFSVTHF